MSGKMVLDHQQQLQQRARYASDEQANKRTANNEPKPTIRFQLKTQANHYFLQLGTFTRGKRKVEDMQGVIAESRRVGGH